MSHLSWWHLIGALHGWVGFEFVKRCLRWRGRVKGAHFDRMRLSSAGWADGTDREYEVFDPPPWRIDRWLWWVGRRAITRGTVTLTIAGEPRELIVTEVRRK